MDEKMLNPIYKKYFSDALNLKKVPLSRRNVINSFLTSKTSLDNVSSNDVAKWLRDADRYYKNLIRVSRILYKSSGEYRSLLNYFINMARFYYVIDPIHSSTDKMSKAKVKKDLAKISLQLKKMNLPHELAKVFKTCLIEDVFFGYEMEDNDNYFLYKLNPDYCKITGLADGMYTFSFDLNYFNGNEDVLLTFPEEFQRAYNIMNNNNGNNWFEPDFTKSVCFKFNESDLEIFPPFAGMFEPLLELNDYKKLKKAGAKINNYMLLHQKVPMHDNSNKDYQADNFAISPDAMEYFNSMVNESLPDEIGAIVSPMEINPIKLDKDDKNDKVLEATRDVYNASGVSSHIFNNDKNSTGGLIYSTRKDELFVMSFYRQIERWLNRKIRYGKLIAKNQWEISLLDVTGMNEEKYLEQLTKTGTLGFAVRGRIAAMHKQDYHTLISSLELENDILDLDTKMIPLASSHTGGINQAIEKKQVDNDEDSKPGRPQKSSDEISDSGQANKDSSDVSLDKGGEN